MGVYNMVSLNYECPNCGEETYFIEQLKNNAPLRMKTFYLGDKVWGMKGDDKWVYDLRCNTCNKSHKLFLYFNNGIFTKASVVDIFGNVTRYKKDLNFETISIEDLKNLKSKMEDIQQQLVTKKSEKAALDIQINSLEVELKKITNRINKALKREKLI